MTAPELESLQTELLRAIADAADLGALEEVRVAALGRKGRVSELMQRLGQLPPDARKGFGQAVNSSRIASARRWKRRREALGRAALSRGSPPSAPTSRCRCGPGRSPRGASIP